MASNTLIVTWCLKLYYEIKHPAMDKTISNWNSTLGTFWKNKGRINLLNQSQALTTSQDYFYILFVCVWFHDFSQLQLWNNLYLA